jgi:hypothetical protein
VIARVTNPAGEEEVIEGRYIVSAKARSIVRKDLNRLLNHLSGPHAQHRGRLRFRKTGYAERNYISAGRMVELVSLEGAARPLARAFSNRARGGRRSPAAAEVQARLRVPAQQGATIS